MWHSLKRVQASTAGRSENAQWNRQQSEQLSSSHQRLGVPLSLLSGKAELAATMDSGEGEELLGCEGSMLWGEDAEDESW